MTEAEWWARRDARELLSLVRDEVSHRKFRLFACASCLAFARYDDRIGDMLSVIERYADEEATWNDLSAVRKAARDLVKEAMQRRLNLGGGAVQYIEAAAHPSALHAAESVAPLHEVTAFRDIIHNPFRAPLIPRTVLTWNDGTVPRIAQGIYDGRAFDRMPILHDALLDAGCDDEDILAHCRGAGPHVRGCWVIDLILGKS